MKEKILNFVKGNKVAFGSALTSMGVVGTSLSAFAETSSDAVSTALQTGLHTAVTDFVGYVALVLPIGLTVFGTVFGIKKGMKFFKTVTA